MKLVSDTAMAALRGIALLGMVTECRIYDLVSVETANGSELTYVARSTTVDGWLKHPDASSAIAIINGGQGVANAYRLFLPVGTDITTGDRVEINGAMYTVQDAASEDTWQPLLTVWLRRVE